MPYHQVARASLIPIILGILLLGGIAPASELISLDQRQEKRDQPIPRTGAAEKLPSTVEDIAPTKRSSENDESTQKEDGKTTADWWMVKLTGALICVGLLQAGVFWIQAARLKQTVDKMDEIDTRQTANVIASITQATRAATAMERLAEASITQAGVAKAVLDRERIFNRPFLMIKAICSKHTGAGHSFSYTMTNHGRTSAIITELKPFIEHVNSFRLFDDAYLHEMKQREKRIQRKNLVIRPNGECESSTSAIPYLPGSNIFIAGEVIYSDFFGGTYSSKFCYSLLLPDLALVEEHGKHCNNERA